MTFASFHRIIIGFLLIFPLSSKAPQAEEAPQAGEGPLQLFEWLERSPFAERVNHTDKQVRARVIGLDRINKVRGSWNPAVQERVTGRLVSSTWQIRDGASSAVIYEEAVEVIEERNDARLLFSCSARGCGPSVQWANMVFEQRILYGTESSQRYSVYALGEKEDSTHRVLVYASARSSDRQYLHTEIVVLAP